MGAAGYMQVIKAVTDEGRPGSPGTAREAQQIKAAGGTVSQTGNGGKGLSSPGD